MYITIEENTEGNPLTIGFDYNIKSTGNKKIDKLDFIKMKNLCASKDAIYRVKWQTCKRYLQITYLIRD